VVEAAETNSSERAQHSGKIAEPECCASAFSLVAQNKGPDFVLERSGEKILVNPAVGCCSYIFKARQ
jgi:hypothetical protein